MFCSFVVVDKKAVPLQGETRDAAVNYDRYILQQTCLKK